MSVSRHTVYNLLGSAVPLVTSLLTIPVYLRLIGETRYGVLAIAWLLLGYFGLFDLGLGRATAQRIAALRDGDGRERAETFWTALVLNLGMGLAGGLLIWPAAAYFFGYLFKVDSILRPEVQAAVPWLVLAVPVATLSGVLSGALQGRERFLELNLISVVGTTLFQLLPLATAWLWGADLAVLLPAALLSRVLTLLLMLERCHPHIFKGHALRIDRAQVGHLLRFGGWVTVTAFIGPMMVVLDRFIIGAVTGAKAVTYYTVPFQLAERSTIVSASLSYALFPRLSGAQRDEEQRLALEALRALLAVITPLTVAGIFLIAPFLSLWISQGFAEKSADVGRIILFGFWVNSLAAIPYEQLQARGRPDLVAKCHLVELLPYFLVLYFCLSNLGMIGAALAFSARAAVDFLLLAWLAGHQRYLAKKMFAPLILIVSAFWVESHNRQGYQFHEVLLATHLLATSLWAWREAPEKLRRIGIGLFVFKAR